MDPEMHYGKDHRYIPETSIRIGKGIEVLEDIYCHTIHIVKYVDGH